MAATVSARLLLAAAVALPLLAVGCGDDRQAYCDAVHSHQKELSDIVDSGRPDALLRALPVLQDLRSKAPSDITDEWQQVIDRIEALQDALHDAGVDPATYDRKHPPRGLTREEKDRIDAAARDLGGGTTLRALQDLDQQARDVCHTPLTV